MQLSQEQLVAQGVDLAVRLTELKPHDSLLTDVEPLASAWHSAQEWWGRGGATRIVLDPLVGYAAEPTQHEGISRLLTLAGLPLFPNPAPTWRRFENSVAVVKGLLTPDTPIALKTSQFAELPPHWTVGAIQQGPATSIVWGRDSPQQGALRLTPCLSLPEGLVEKRGTSSVTIPEIWGTPEAKRYDGENIEVVVGSRAVKGLLLQHVYPGGWGTQLPYRLPTHLHRETSETYGLTRALCLSPFMLTAAMYGKSYIQQVRKLVMVALERVASGDGQVCYRGETRLLSALPDRPGSIERAHAFLARVTNAGIRKMLAEDIRLLKSPYPVTKDIRPQGRYL